ncbi:hypothetical protein C1646_775166 [Rhizophagus diaphanus]|nr:hypothetical protein C1646_775166 [Rhizophagus diaphanus] [Rhizophagus sp. MUCL 43196]
MSSELELLRQRITELEAENAKLRQIIEENTKLDGQLQNDKEVTSEISVVVVSDSSPIHDVHSQLKLSEQIEDVPKVPDQEETSEDMETDAFLVKVHKKSISNDFRKRNKEKKLSKAGQDQVSLQKISDTASGISSSEKLVMVPREFPYDPELAKLYSQDKLEYCLTCNTSTGRSASIDWKYEESSRLLYDMTEKPTGYAIRKSYYDKSSPAD